jgi:catechol 2,3-dioxygenase-like lactoylglutathione lyase family enzyme
MIDHITIPVSNLARSRAFYERVFAPLGYKVSFGEDGVFWAFDLLGKGLFEIYEEKEPFTPIHVAFRVGSREAVDAFHRAGLAAGAKDNGPPGPRTQYTPSYYAAFLLDADGHNIEAMLD